MPFKVTDTGLYVFVPDDREPRFTCTTIVASQDGEHRLCGERFADEGKWLRHVTRCAQRHSEEIQKASPSNRLPDWLGPGNATDYEDWLDEADAGGETNRRKVIRGAKKF